MVTYIIEAGHDFRKIVKKHPTDDEAIRELFVNRRSPNAKTYPYPYDMTKEELDDIFRPKHTN